MTTLNPSSIDRFQSSRVIVENNTGATIPALTLVKLNGMGTSYPQVIVGSPSAPLFGITTQSLLNSNIGLVYTLGFLMGVNTNSWAAGTLLYCDPSGALTTSPVSVGDQPVAASVKQDAQFGILYIFIQTNQYHGSLATTLSGDVTGSGTNSIATTIVPNVVSNAKLAQMVANSLKGNNTGSPANAADLTVTQVTAMLNALARRYRRWRYQRSCPSSGGGNLLAELFPICKWGFFPGRSIEAEFSNVLHAKSNIATGVPIKTKWGIHPWKLCLCSWCGVGDTLDI